EGDQEKADRAIVLLSKFLRRSIDSDPVALIPLSDEFQNVEDYLAIERVRFEGRLIVAVERDARDAEWQVPPFLLQPLLENVIKHAVSKVSRPVSVKIASSVADQRLTISVHDDGPAQATDHPGADGVGLNTTAERLSLIYGADAELQAETVEPHGFTVKIRIPRVGGHGPA
ncbi:MAG: histidine kinase, partial [Parvularculaceae bacterium]|nr:histidine kinase [Parvularculaceae bacterium]